MENYIIANASDTGKVRNVNEDSMTTFDSPNGRIVVVCDGMGGQNAGDVASQLAVKVIEDILKDNTFASPAEAISSSMVAANQAILRRAASDSSLEGMGSTCVMLLIKDGKVYYGSVGDSRIYYAAEGMIRQLTKDQSYVQTLVDAGELSPEDAEHHRDKNQITNALGLEGMTPPIIGKLPITPEPGGIFLLCSDGLSGMVSNNMILNTLSSADASLQEKADALVDMANEAGGVDNITVQLVEFPADGQDAAAGLSNVKEAGKAVRRKTNSMTYSLMGVVLLVVAALCLAWWFFLRPQPEPQSQPKQTISTQPKKTKTDTTPTVKKEEVIVIEQETPSQEAKSDKAQKAKERRILKKQAEEKAKREAEEKAKKEAEEKAKKEAEEKAKQEALKIKYGNLQNEKQ